MKKTAFIFLFLSLAAYGCRRKNKNENSKKCNYALFAWRAASGGIYKLVSVDTATGQSVHNLPFPQVHNTEGYLDGKSKCYYTLQIDAGRLILYKFDLANKTTAVYTGRPGWVGNSKGTNISLTYSKATSKFYFLYYYVINPTSSYNWFFYEMSITGDSITNEPITLTPVPDGMFAPLLENPIDGTIYFSTREKLHRFLPMSSEILPVNLQSTLSLLQFSQSNGLLYGIANNKYGIPLEFRSGNPSNGSVVKINDMPPLPAKYKCIFFDQCNSYYIFQNGGVDTTVDIYWLDTKDGSVRKHLTAIDAYVGLICVNLD